MKRKFIAYQLVIYVFLFLWWNETTRHNITLMAFQKQQAEHIELRLEYIHLVRLYGKSARQCDLFARLAIAQKNYINTLEGSNCPADLLKGSDRINGIIDSIKISIQ